MFEISDLKEKKLPDLQEIAQSLGMKKFKTLKKEELIYSNSERGKAYRREREKG